MSSNKRRRIKLEYELSIEWFPHETSQHLPRILRKELNAFFPHNSIGLEFRDFFSPANKVHFISPRESTENVRRHNSDISRATIRFRPFFFFSTFFVLPRGTFFSFNVCSCFLREPWVCWSRGPDSHSLALLAASQSLKASAAFQAPKTGKRRAVFEILPK